MPPLASRGQQWPETVENPGTPPRTPTPKGETPKLLTWAGQGWPGAHPPSTPARGRGQGAAAGQGVAGGHPGCILGAGGRLSWGHLSSRRPPVRPNSPRGPVPGMGHFSSQRVGGTWGACGKEREAPKRGSRSCRGARALQASVEASLWGESMKGN